MLLTVIMYSSAMQIQDSPQISHAKHAIILLMLW